MAQINIPETRPTTEIASHRIEKSTDNGETWVAQITIPYDPTDAATYDQTTRSVFWVDPAPVAAEILRTTAIHQDASEDPYTYIYATPSETQLCNVYGFLTEVIQGPPTSNATGASGGKVGDLSGCPVQVFVREDSMAKWLENASVPGQALERQLAIERQTTVYTDAEGKWQVNLLPGLEVGVAVIEARVGLRFRVPNQAVLNFRDANKFRIPGRSQPDASWSTLALVTWI